MEFDKSKILTCVTADQLVEGQLGWANDTISWLESDVIFIPPYAVSKSNDIEFPFESKERGKRRYFYPAPEPLPFAVGDTVEIIKDVIFPPNSPNLKGLRFKVDAIYRQDDGDQYMAVVADNGRRMAFIDPDLTKWAKKVQEPTNEDIKPGTILHVNGYSKPRTTTKASEPSFKVGDRVELTTSQLPFFRKGTQGTVSNTKLDSCKVHVNVDNRGEWAINKADLKIITQPTYRPFANAEEFKPYRDEWFKKKGDVGFDRAEYYDNVGIKNSKGFFLTYADFVACYERENGEPCGIKEQA
ncbi:MAG: hypothetical protein AB7D24_12565 [Sphaerochaeta sp.]|uniref:hypothetical protein n=1 Tax=Sphaerochaeta sp. TaxID=1972642 RepID=UPI003D0D6835